MVELTGREMPAARAGRHPPATITSSSIPPSLGMLTVNALTASDGAIPVQESTCLRLSLL